MAADVVLTLAQHSAQGVAFSNAKQAHAKFVQLALAELTPPHARPHCPLAVTAVMLGFRVWKLRHVFGTLTVKSAKVELNGCTHAAQLTTMSNATESVALHTQAAFPAEHLAISLKNLHGPGMQLEMSESCRRSTVKLCIFSRCWRNRACSEGKNAWKGVIAILRGRKVVNYISATEIANCWSGTIPGKRLCTRTFPEL
jgi:hypothetical protein